MNTIIQKQSDVKDIISNIRLTIQQNRNLNIIYGDFIFNKFLISENKIIFKFIVPNKIAITISYVFNSNKVTIYIKNNMVLEGKLYEKEINNYQKFLLNILRYMDTNKLNTEISIYILIQLLDSHINENIFDIKVNTVLIQRINVYIGRQLFRILEQSFIKTL